jgi:membrane-associated protease RseP (regulator of RpoE activity)
MTDRNALLRLAAIVAVVVAATLYFNAWPVLVVILALIAMVMLHEFGHFLVAKRSGMKVSEYFLGFGPRVLSFYRGETEYGVKAIPAGGYVRILGMTGLEEVDPADESRTYRQSSFPRRIAVAVAGSGVQLLLALLLLWTIFAVVGVPTSRPGIEVVGLEHFVGEQSPAQRAGIVPGDVIVGADGTSTAGPNSNASLAALKSVIGSHPNAPVHLVVSHNGVLSHLIVTPVLLSSVVTMKDGVPTRLASPTSRPEGFVGIEIEPFTPDIRANPVVSVARAGSAFGSLIAATATDFTHVFSPHGLLDFASAVLHGGAPIRSSVAPARGSIPASSGSSSSGQIISVVGAVQIGAAAARDNIGELLLILALVDISVALINLFPMLPLDGGHVAIAIYERIRSRRDRPYHADVAKLLPYTYVFLAVLLFLGLGAVYLNILHPVHISGG